MQAPCLLPQGTVHHRCGQDEALGDLLSLLALTVLILEGDNSAFFPRFSKAILTCHLIWCPALKTALGSEVPKQPETAVGFPGLRAGHHCMCAVPVFVEASG